MQFPALWPYFAFFPIRLEFWSLPQAMWLRPSAVQSLLKHHAPFSAPPRCPLASPGRPGEICISYLHSCCNCAPSVGFSPTSQTRVAKQPPPNHQTLLWSCCPIVPALWTWSDPRNSKGNCSLFSLWWGNRISLSCTVTVMFIDLFPHNNSRSPVSPVVKQVTFGLSGLNYWLQTIPVQTSHIIITSFISIIWTLIMLVHMSYDC